MKRRIALLTAALVCVAGVTLTPTAAHAAAPERSVTDTYYFSPAKRLLVKATLRYKVDNRRLVKFVYVDSRTQIRGGDNIWRTKKLCSTQKVVNTVFVDGTLKFQERSAAGKARITSDANDLADLRYVDRDLARVRAVGQVKPGKGCSFTTKSVGIDDFDFPRL